MPVRQHKVEWNGEIFGLGAYRSLPDNRDWTLPAAYVETVGAPEPEGFIWSTPLHNQGQQGSCVGQSIGKVAEIAATYGLAAGLGLDVTEVEPYQLSRSFPYFLGRRAINTIGSDSGCFARDVLKAMVTEGIPSEALCPYSDKALLLNPEPVVWASARLHRVVEYYALSAPEEIEVVLSGRHAVTYAQVVYENFVRVTGREGYFPRPEGRVAGAHQTTIVAWDRNRTVPGWTGRGAFLVENSWGEGHGIENPYTRVSGGHYWIPYEAFWDRNLVWDIWTVHSVPLIR